MKQEITFDEFLEIEKKLDIRIGTITSVERIPKKDKLLKLTVSFGEESRTVVTNLGGIVEDEKVFQGARFPFIMNLKPSVIGGVESTAMIMVAEHNGVVQLTGSEVSDGAKLL